MKNWAAILSVLLVAVSAAQAASAASTPIADAIETIRAKVLKENPQAYLFQASIPFGRADSLNLEAFQADFAKPDDHLSYLAGYLYTDSESPIAEATVYPQYYLPSRCMCGIPSSTGGCSIPPPRPEGADLHPRLQGLNIDLQDLQQDVKGWVSADDSLFAIGGDVLITTVGRIRGRDDHYVAAHGAFDASEDSRAIVIITERKNPPSWGSSNRVFAQFFVLDATTGQLIVRSSIEIHAPPPPVSGAVSSGGH